VEYRVSTKVKVDTAQLRVNARSLHEANGGRKASSAVPGSLGAARAVAVFEQFDAYWRSGLSNLSSGVDSLSTALGSAADVYEQRDAKSAESFTSGAPHAF